MIDFYYCLASFSVFVGNSFFLDAASTTPCKNYPSEYAFPDNSVSRADAKCMHYPRFAADKGTLYTHCDGEQLKLSDSDTGFNMYAPASHYAWPARRDAQLLFIFPTKASLTTITLHYYRDSDRGLSALRFYAVSDDFDIWDTPTIGIPHVDVTAVPPGGEHAGRRNVSINVNFNTKKVLMYKYTSNFQLAVSEVEFFNCTSNNMMETSSGPVATTITPTTAASSGTPDGSSDKTPLSVSATNLFFITDQSGAVNTRAEESNTMITTIDSQAKDSEASGSGEAASGVATVAIVVGIVLVILIALACIGVIALALFLRKSTHFKQDYDLSYSTLCRETAQQIQPQSQQAPADLYDQIQLSPSTGQTEVIPKAEAENINSLSPHQPDVSPNVDTDQCNMVKEQSNVSTSEQPTYTFVKKKQKKSKLMKGKELREDQDNAAEKKGEGFLMACSLTVVAEIKQDQTIQGEAMPPSLDSVEPSEALYTAVKKKPKDNAIDNEEKILPTSTHTVEKLYTAVKKERKDSALGEKDKAPTHTVEDLYSAVMKKPRNDWMEGDAEAAPPIPVHTVEELYTAVQKKPKDSAIGNKEKAPPIPPHAVEDCC